MSIWNTLFGWFGFTTDADMTTSDYGFSHFDNHHCDININPASGLPMLGECGGVDIGGNPFGTELHHDDNMWSSTNNGFDSDWGSTSSWDDTFSCSSSWDD